MKLLGHVVAHWQRHGRPGLPGAALGDGLDLAPRHLHREPAGLDGDQPVGLADHATPEPETAELDFPGWRGRETRGRHRLERRLRGAQLTISLLRGAAPAG